MSNVSIILDKMDTSRDHEVDEQDQDAQNIHFVNKILTSLQSTEAEYLHRETSIILAKKMTKALSLIISQTGGWQDHNNITNGQ